MRDADRFKLIGTYTTPRVRVGRVLLCEARDCDVIVTGYRDARIPWPIGRRKGTTARGAVIYGGLAEAVRRESNQAVCYWFRVTPWTVSKWRKALGVEMTNPGTHTLRVGYGVEEWFAEARAKGHTVPVSVERREMAGNRYRGKPREPHVVAAMRAGRRGKPQSADAKAKMRAAQAAQLSTGWRPNGLAWIEAEDELVRTLPAPEAARRTGRSLASVYVRRIRLGVSDGRATNGRRRRASP